MVDYSTNKLEFLDHMVDCSTAEMQENIGSNYQLLTW